MFNVETAERRRMNFQPAMFNSSPTAESIRLLTREFIYYLQYDNPIKYQLKSIELRRNLREPNQTISTFLKTIEKKYETNYGNK